MADETLLVTIVEAAELLHISRSLTYELVKDRKLRTVTIGTRRLITRAELERFIKSLSRRRRRKIINGSTQQQETPVAEVIPIRIAG